MDPHAHQAVKEEPKFSDRDLDYIIQLCRRDNELCSFIERMDEKRTGDLARTAIISAIAYRAADIIATRRQKAQQAAIEAKAKQKLEEEARRLQEAGPRIPASEIPELQGNGATQEKKVE